MTQKKSSYVIQIILGLFILASIFIVFATLVVIDLGNVPERYGHTAEQGFVCAPSAHGNGVYSFSCAEKEFGLSLSTFREAYPDLRIVAMVSTASCTLGRRSDREYVIVTE